MDLEADSQYVTRMPDGNIAQMYHLLIVALLPYAIFSLFHALTFTRTTLMPQFLPPGPPASAGGAPAPHPLAKKLQVWVKGKLT